MLAMVFLTSIVQTGYRNMGASNLPLNALAIDTSQRCDFISAFGPGEYLTLAWLRLLSVHLS
jgi:hypothetical protein